MVLFYGTRFWNDYMNALMYLADDSRMPLQVVLRNLIIVNTVASSMYTDPEELAVRAKLAEQLKFGIIVVSAAPLMIVYPFVQKYFAIGVTVGQKDTKSEKLKKNRHNLSVTLCRVVLCELLHETHYCNTLGHAYAVCCAGLRGKH